MSIQYPGADHTQLPQHLRDVDAAVGEDKGARLRSRRLSWANYFNTMDH